MWWLFGNSSTQETYRCCYAAAKNKKRGNELLRNQLLFLLQGLPHFTTALAFEPHTSNLGPCHLTCFFIFHLSFNTSFSGSCQLSHSKCIHGTMTSHLTTHSMEIRLKITQQCVQCIQTCGFQNHPIFRILRRHESVRIVL